MDIIIRTIGFPLSDALRGNVVAKLCSLEWLAPRCMRARVTLARQSAHISARQFRASAQCEIAGHDVRAVETASSIYEALDLLAEKIRRRLCERRKLWLMHRHRDVREDRAIRQFKLSQLHPTAARGLTLQKGEIA